MGSFQIEGGHKLNGDIHPQGAKNEALQVICACLLTDQEIIIKNIPEIIEVDVIELNLGDSIRLTDLSLPEGSEIPGLTEENDQMVVSVNAPKAEVEEEPLGDDALEGEKDGDEITEGASDESSEESEAKKEASE